MHRLCALLLCAIPSLAAELELRYTALEHILAEQLFTQEGRHYVRGNRASKCQFAYLEKPHFQGADGKLRIRAKFTGRSALNMFGQCVGLGDAFTAAITAVPQYKDGNIGLGNVAAVSEDRTGYYVRRVCTALSSSLMRDFRYPIGAAAKSALEEPGAQPNYPRELRNFRVTEIRVSNDALILAVDFELTVK